MKKNSNRSSCVYYGRKHFCVILRSGLKYEYNKTTILYTHKTVIISLTHFSLSFTFCVTLSSLQKEKNNHYLSVSYPWEFLYSLIINNIYLIQFLSVMPKRFSYFSLFRTRMKVKHFFLLSLFIVLLTRLSAAARYFFSNFSTGPEKKKKKLVETKIRTNLKLRNNNLNFLFHSHTNV